MPKRRLGLILAGCVLAVFVGCGPQLVVGRTDPGLSYGGPLLLYRGEPFSGLLETELGAPGAVRRTPFVDGRPDGTEREWYNDEQLSAEGAYESGKKTGVHQGWFPDGSQRFWYEYQNGELHGEMWEWYPNGNLASYARMYRGHLVGKKKWRADGQIYANYVLRGNRVVGLPGSRLCNAVRAPL